MFSLASLQGSRRHRLRSLVCVSLCATLPLQAGEPPTDAEGHPFGGPGWYDSSWDLVRGLDMAEVPDLEAELALWIDACWSLDSASAPA